MVVLAGRGMPAGESLLDLSGIAEMRGIVVDEDALVLGALTTFTEMRRSPLVRERLPALAEVAASVGAAQVQNRGTLGGNVANASPAGDTLPLLLATDASIVAGSVRGERAIPADEFFTGYRITALEPDELVVRVRIPLRPGREVRFRKVGTRRAMAISKVVMAVAWLDDGGRWRDVRVALGSVAERPIRARRTEAALEGARPGAGVAALAAATVAAEIEPIDDVRSTAAYRRAVTGRVLRRIVLGAGTDSRSDSSVGPG
jgi:CO/xanthine dehydrogenase FAD-binding subunit